MKKIKSRSGLRGMKFLATGIVAAALAVTSVSFVRGQVQVPAARETGSVLPRFPYDEAKELAMKITQSFTFAAVGDIIIYHPVGNLNDPSFQALMKVMRGADMTYANMERPIIDESDPNYHGPFVGSPKTVIDDLKMMGIRVMTTANNHEFDAGDDGIFRTNRLLNEARITYAGSGKDLTEARKAQYAPTPKGTIGVVGMWSIDPGSSGRIRDADARENWPGVNALHVTPYNVVTAEQMASLRKIRDAWYAHRTEVNNPVALVPPGEGPNELFLVGSWFNVGEDTGSMSYKMDPSDLSGNIQSVRLAKHNSDFMIVAVHCHQNSFNYQSYTHDHNVPDFLVKFAHMAIDNGADVFIGHGVHTLRGVEIYKGKPIFYGVGNFFAQDTGYSPSEGQADQHHSMKGAKGVGHSPDDYEALLTTSRYESGKLVEVRLYPADLGIDGTRPAAEFGTPMTPSPEQAQRTLKRVQDISQRFGTTISIEDNVGVIRVAQTGAKQSGADPGGER